MNAILTRRHVAGAHNQRGAELSSVLGGLPVDRQTPVGESTAVLRRCRLGIRAWLSLVAAAALAAVVGAGELRPEVEEVLGLTPNPARGAEIFAYCSKCHASPANGLPEGWVPNISGQHPSYLAKQLVEYRHTVRWGAQMESVSKGHALRGLQDIADVVAFVAAQPADWNRPAAGYLGASEDRSRYRNSCGGCHGQTGEGSNRGFVPRIGGLNVAYLLRQMHDAVDGRRPNLEISHLRLLEDLDVHQLLGLSRYISRLGAGASAPGVSEVPNPSIIHDPAAPGRH